MIVFFKGRLGRLIELVLGANFQLLEEERVDWEFLEILGKAGRIGEFWRGGKGNFRGICRKFLEGFNFNWRKRGQEGGYHWFRKMVQMDGKIAKNFPGVFLEMPSFTILGNLSGEPLRRRVESGFLLILISPLPLPPIRGSKKADKKLGNGIGKWRLKRGKKWSLSPSCCPAVENSPPGGGGSPSLPFPPFDG
jgi:hypothetical protein